MGVLTAKKSDASLIDSLYNGRKLLWGDLHNHAKTGGTSDGKRTLENHKGSLESLYMDFVAVLDHRQVRHMYLPEWDDGTFICGTEPGTKIVDGYAIEEGKREMHYNMLFPSPKPLEELLSEFTEYEFEGGQEGHFRYPSFTRERFCQLVNTVFDKGGFYVHPHPKQYMRSNNPLDYFFRDGQGLEVFYHDMRSEYTKENYKLWCELLALGKKVYATAGEDGHSFLKDNSLTAIYAEEKSSPSVVSHLREGDFVCGSVAMRACVGKTRMGGSCDFEGKRYVIAVDDFHRSVKDPHHKYRIDILDDKGVVHTRRIKPDGRTVLAFEASPDVKFYRAEIFDVSENLLISIANPIWNEK